MNTEKGDIHYTILEQWLSHTNGYLMVSFPIHLGGILEQINKVGTVLIYSWMIILLIIAYEGKAKALNVPARGLKITEVVGKPKYCKY